MSKIDSGFKCIVQSLYILVCIPLLEQYSVLSSLWSHCLFRAFVVHHLPKANVLYPQNIPLVLSGHKTILSWWYIFVFYVAELTRYIFQKLPPPSGITITDDYPTEKMFKFFFAVFYFCKKAKKAQQRKYTYKCKGNYSSCQNT